MADTIRDHVLDGSLEPGTILREAALAEALGVSRTPVREAIMQLIAEGALVKGSNGAVTVFRPSIDELRHIFEIRIPLESLATKVAVAENDETPAKVRAAWEVLRKASPGREWEMAHQEFHLAPCRAARRSRLLQLIESLRMQSEPYIQLLMRLDRDFADRAYEDHRSITIAIVERQAERASELVAAHLQDSADRAFQIFDQYLRVPRNSSDPFSWLD